jgi:hypothetical protein
MHQKVQKTLFYSTFTQVGIPGEIPRICPKIVLFQFFVKVSNDLIHYEG